MLRFYCRHCWFVRLFAQIDGSTSFRCTGEWLTFFLFLEGLLRLAARLDLKTCSFFCRLSRLNGSSENRKCKFNRPVGQRWRHWQNLQRFRRRGASATSLRVEPAEIPGLHGGLGRQCREERTPRSTFPMRSLRPLRCWNNLVNCRHTVSFLSSSGIV